MYGLFNFVGLFIHLSQGKVQYIDFNLNPYIFQIF